MDIIMINKEMLNMCNKNIININQRHLLLIIKYGVL